MVPIITTAGRVPWLNINKRDQSDSELHTHRVFNEKRKNQGGAACNQVELQGVRNQYSIVHNKLCLSLDVIEPLAARRVWQLPLLHPRVLGYTFINPRLG